MDNEITKQLETPAAREQNALAPDWTESEWFAEWLKLARGEYEPAH